MSDKYKTILFLLSEKEKLSREFRSIPCSSSTIMARTKLMNQLLYVRNQLNLYSPDEVRQAQKWEQESKLLEMKRKYSNDNKMEVLKQEDKKDDLGMIEIMLLLEIASKDAFLGLALYVMEVRGLALFGAYELTKNKKGNRL